MERAAGNCNKLLTCFRRRCFLAVWRRLPEEAKWGCWAQVSTLEDTGSKLPIA